MKRKSVIREAHAGHLSFLIALFLLSSVLFNPVFVSAQTEEEMKTLRMYFGSDELVTTPTRTLKPLSQVAENIEVVTAEEIEAMNAHMLSQVLEMVTGLYIYNALNDFGSSGFVFIQGSDYFTDDRRTLILLDGMPWNFLAGGTHTVNTIPVTIVKRIEIIKGPASSSWGSSLGGVINIVTKDTGERTVPSGVVSAAYGERDSQDYNAEMMGKAGTVGYYLYAGRIDSDGLRKDRYFERDSLYSKFDFSFTPDIKLTLTAGYSDPDFKYADIPAYDYSSTGIFRAFFTTATLAAGITDELSFEASIYRYKQKFVSEIDAISSGDTLNQLIYDEETDGGTAKLIWNSPTHNAAAGYDVSHGSLDQISRSAGLDDDVNHPGISKWALFVNDTISIGDLTITPGLRYDDNNVSGDFTSPSIGATYKLDKNTLLRASVARGFAYPPITFTSSDEYFLKPNPDLDPETVWSYQIGAESLISNFLYARTAFFHHIIKNEIQARFDETISKLQYVNSDGKVKRTGAEIGLETAPVYNVSLKTGFSYVRKKLEPEEDFPDTESATDIYDYNIIVRYNDAKSFSAQLSGNYTWWNYPSDWNAKYNTFIWDLNLIKKIYSSEKISSDIFLAAHNIFNGSYYIDKVYDNPRRWLEAGVKLKF